MTEDLLLEKLDIKQWLELNSKLNQKKNKLRKELKKMGVLKKGAKNEYDNYQYFSEAQYKELFTDLFSKHLLELKADEVEYSLFDGTEKQVNGRTVKIKYTLTDIETGFFETSTISGEGIDKGDKAGYKADTGSLKYYLANNFMVATGDDAEKETPSAKFNKKTTNIKLASPNQVNLLRNLYSTEEEKNILSKLKKDSFENLTMAEASNLISKRSND